MAAVGSILFPNQRSGGVLVKWKVKKGARVRKGQEICVCRPHGAPSGDATTEERRRDITVTSPMDGRVRQLFMEEGQSVTVAAGEPPLSLCEVEYCTHPQVRDGVCMVCARDVDESHLKGAVKLHAQGGRELLVSGEAADDHAKALRDDLLGRRKLQLILDLDHTLIHATASEEAKGHHHDDVFSFTLDEQWRAREYFVKKRAGLADFLSSMSKQFMLSVDTQGTRPYAEGIVANIDPDNRLFGSRVVSRTDVRAGAGPGKRLSWMHLNASDKSMVIILDDRTDVWNGSLNVLKVEPYRYFKEATEVNNAAGGGVLGSDKPSGVDKATSGDGGAGETATGLQTQEEDVGYLQHMQEVLSAVHGMFFSEGVAHKDVRYCLEVVRRHVLAGVIVCITGVHRSARPALAHSAELYGAKVVDVMSPEVTHVATSPERGVGTEKFREATKLGVGKKRKYKASIVDLNWLSKSMQLWKRQDEKKFAIPRWEPFAVKAAPVRIDEKRLEAAAWERVQRHAAAAKGAKAPRPAPRRTPPQPPPPPPTAVGAASASVGTTAPKAVKRPRDTADSDASSVDQEFRHAAAIAEDDEVLAQLEAEGHDEEEEHEGFDYPDESGLPTTPDRSDSDDSSSDGGEFEAMFARGLASRSGGQ